MKNNKVYIVAAFTILIAGFTLFTLEKSRIINVYQKPVSASNTEDARPVNDVDYTPQTTPPDPTVNSEKNPGTSPPPTNTGNVTVSITRANQDQVTKNLNVGVLVEGTKVGTCTLTLSKDGTDVLTKEAPVAQQGGLVTCAGFTLLSNEIPATGTYILKVSIGTGSANQEVELSK